MYKKTKYFAIIYIRNIGGKRMPDPAAVRDAASVSADARPVRPAYSTPRRAGLG